MLSPGGDRQLVNRVPSPLKNPFNDLTVNVKSSYSSPQTPDNVDGVSYCGSSLLNAINDGIVDSGFRVLFVFYCIA